ncbi:hypothetical protein [Acetobacter sp.]|uniref:hypothetical protein n=1 Tax=Acetobacter sp. TaxID=440 RepID=UPI0039ED4196
MSAVVSVEDRFPTPGGNPEGPYVVFFIDPAIYSIEQRPETGQMSGDGVVD